MGFWLSPKSDANGLYLGDLMVFGKVPESTPITLCHAPDVWNMVGYPSGIARHHAPWIPKTVAQELVGINYHHVETYDPTVPPYYLKILASTDPMLPGFGYWILLNAGGGTTWTVATALPEEALV